MDGGPWTAPSSTVYGLWSTGCLHDSQEIVRFQAGATHQGSVDLGLAEKLLGVISLDRATILDADGLGCFRAEQICQRRANIVR